jgi:hypothetical protein
MTKLEEEYVLDKLVIIQFKNSGECSDLASSAQPDH